MEEKLNVTKLMKWLSFLIPAFGLLVFAIHCADNPEGAKKCGKLAVWGIVVALVPLALVLPLVLDSIL